MGKKPIHDKEWEQAGILRIRDFLKGCSFMTIEHLHAKYKVLCDLLFYNGLRSAIPRQWVDIIKKDNNVKSTPIEQYSLTVKLNNRNVEVRKTTCSQYY